MTDPCDGVKVYDDNGNVVVAAGDLGGLPFDGKPLSEGAFGVYVSGDLTENTKALLELYDLK